MSNFETCNVEELQTVEGGFLSYIKTAIKVAQALSDLTGGPMDLKTLGYTGPGSTPTKK
ncbi:MAG: bacteriocin [Planctomycetaceae bacterium]